MGKALGRISSASKCDTKEVNLTLESRFLRHNFSQGMLDGRLYCLNRCKNCRAISLSEGAGCLVCGEHLDRGKTENSPYDDIGGGSLKRVNKCYSVIVDTLEN